MNYKETGQHKTNRGGGTFHKMQFTIVLQFSFLACYPRHGVNIAFPLSAFSASYNISD